MAQSDDAREQINKLRDKKWVDKRLDALAPAGDKRRSDLQRALGMDKNIWTYGNLGHRFEAARDVLGALGEKSRPRFFEGMFSNLGPSLEQLWHDAARRPCNSEYNAAPFRAPSRASTLLAQRAQVFVPVADCLHGLDPNPTWIAENATGLLQQMNYYWHKPLGRLLAATLNAGGPDADEVREVLLDTVAGRHESARFGDHTIVALLNSHNPEDWKAIGDMLLAAQRQEGLRQSVLERVDESHPDAFRYFIGLVLEHDLARFSSVVRAFDVWFGTAWAGGSVKPVNEGLTVVARCLDDRAERERLVTEGTPQEAYFALWTVAFLDAEDAMRLGEAVIEQSADPERRFAAWLILDRANLQPELTTLIRGHMLAGKETCGHIRMLWAERLAVTVFEKFDETLFEAMGRYYDEMPKKETELGALLWPWHEFTNERRTPARALVAIAGPDPMRMLPYAESLESWECARFMRHLVGRFSQYENHIKRPPKGPPSPEVVDFLVRMTVDSRRDVHGEAFACLKHKKVAVEAAEVDLLVKNLQRVAATFRKGAIERLAKLKADDRLAVAERLLGDKQAKRRAAGLELCATLIEKDARADQARALIKTHEEALSGNETKDAAARLVADVADEPSTEDCFGLLPAGSRAKAIEPRFVGVATDTKAARACLESLVRLFKEHSDTEIEADPDYYETREQGRRERVGDYFPGPHRISPRFGDNPNEYLDRLPLREVWLEWVENRSANLRDDDGLELVRSWVLSEHADFTKWYHGFVSKAFSSTHWQAHRAFNNLVSWLPLLVPSEAQLKCLVQIAEDRLATFVKTGDYQVSSLPYGGGKTTPLASDIGVANSLSSYTPEIRQRAEATIRIARLEMLALDLNVPDSTSGPRIEDFCLAYDAGHFNEHDFTWLLLAPRPARYGHSADRVSFGDIHGATGLKPHKSLQTRRELQAVAMAVRDRLIDIELTRGERPSPATDAAARIRHAGGAQTLFRLITAMGKDKLHRGGFYFYSEQPTRQASLSRLISVTAPGEGDTPEAFAELYAKHGIQPARMLEIAIYAPQWARHAEHALAMPGLEDAAWWIHAHTKQSDYFRDQEFREIWNAQIHERTSLTGDDLLDGAVDVAWFHETYYTLGADNWQAVQKAAKYASSSGGHKRAELFATAMLGQTKPAELEARIDKTRHQDSLRALGLVPLEKKTAKAETLRRYTLMQEYKRQSRQFGSQRQASEGRAVDIAMQNLARTAGYKDPARLQWAMEAESVADLAKGPVVEVHKEKGVETTVTLAIDEAGAPELTITKDGKGLKAIPAKLRKHKPFAELKGRVTELRRQASRMRLSLEEAMCRGDTFTGGELAELLAHPILRPMLERLVFIGDKTSLIGYPEEAGKLLRSHDDAREPVGKNDSLRLAHPLDLLERGNWHAWQRECFAAERVQPFKQVFREVYPKTDTELGTGKAKSKHAPDITKRYAGHQVNPRQALALLKARNWAFKPEEGVRRVWHEKGLVAELTFEEHFYTPAEIEGLTLEGVYFRKRSDVFDRLSIADVPGIVFSEAMRDLDLVVSVAHMGGVDPEASASTIEMRAALLEEAARLLNLNNVRVEGHHAHIDGTLARYALHLGSASVTVKPGKALYIVAVHSQYRGRLFLPFADDDPRTAEVMAKALLLARDSEIRDPGILRQIEG